MSDKTEKSPQKELGDIMVEEEIERKYFPKSHERKRREKAMKDPDIFEKELKEKLRKCLIKKEEP